MEEELEETSLRSRSAASRHHHQRRRAKKPPPTTNYDDVFGGPPRHAVPFSGVPDDYAEVFGGVSVSCSIPFLDLPAGQMDGWDCATGESVNGVDYGEIFGRCDFGDFAVPYEELFGRGKRDEREMDMHVASSNGRSSVKDRSGPQIVDPSAFVQEYSNEDCIPYLEDALFSSSPVDSDEIPKEYNTSYNKSIRTQAKELLHTTASVPQPQTGFTYVVEPTKPPEEPPLFNDDTVTHGNSVRPNPRSSEEPVSPEVPFLSVNDMNLQIRSAKPPPPARPPTPKFLVNERQKINTFAKTDSVSQQEEPQPFLKSDSLPPNFDFVPNLKLDKREKPKLKSNPKIFSKSDSLPPSFGSELDAMKEAMEFAQARLKTAKELHEKKREGKITELPLKKRHVKDESLEGSEGVRPRVLRSVSLASNFNNGGEFMKEQGSGVAATQAVHELEKSGKWRSDDEFYVLTSIEPEKERGIKVGITGIEPLGDAERESVQIGEMPPTELGFSENLNADVNATENLEVLGEIEFEEDLKREEKATIVPSLIQNNLELEKETGEDKTEASKDDSNRVQNVEDRENTGDVQVGTEEGKGSEMEVGAETEEEGKRRSEMEWELERENVKRLEEERERERKREELEKERQKEKEIEEEKERAHKLEEETDRAVKLEEEKERAVKLEEETDRAVKLEEEKERVCKLEEEKEMAVQLEEEKEMARKLEEEKERKLQMDKEREEKERVEMERIMIEERERLERERLKKLEEESERERFEKEREREEDMQRKLEQEREKERKLEEERQQEKEREKEMVKKMEEEKERERKLEEEIEKEREMVRKLVEEREQERERVRRLEEEKEREREMARKLNEEKERERKLEEEIEKERGRVKKLEEEREWERERVRILEEERELERERVRKLEEEREQDRERVRELEEEREKQMIEKEREWKERDRIEREREQKERERIEKEREQKERDRIEKEREQKEEEKKLEEEKEKQRKEKEEGEKQRRMEKEREEKEMALRFEAERRRFERERAEERERMTKLRGEKTKERKSDEERERGRRMKERERKTEGRKSDEEGEKARERKSDEERERERERRARKEREREKEEREREREKDRLAMERATQERAERIAIERITAARQRALLENRDKEETSNRGAGEGYEKKRVKGEEEKKEREGERNAREARLRAERAAVERATAEARERAIEKAKAEAGKERDRLERFKSFNMSSSQYQDTQESHFKRTQSDSALIHDDGESALRHKARLERQQRTAERAAKALAEKNRRDIMAQREQAERDRMAEHLDADVKRWSSGKEGNLRALLSTLQYILGQNSGWQPIHLTEVITAADVKKAYRKATLYVHPDKLQQRGASIQHKYICEKVFDLLKEAWNKFNSEER